MKLDRSKPPKEIGEIHFTLPEIKHLQTENGLEVLLVQKKNLPIVQMNLIVTAGSYFDPKNKYGLAKLTGMMIDEGAGKYNALELDNEIDSLGSILEISNDHDSIFLSMSSLEETFDNSLDIFSQIICEPHLAENDFVREQEKALVKIMQYDDDPSYLASTEFEKIVFKNTGYENPVPGTEASLKNISIEDLRNFYKSHFNINNSKLVVVGNIEENLLLEKIGSAFKNYRTGKVYAPEVKPYQFDKRKIYFVHKSDSAQSEVRVGIQTSRRNEKNYFTKLLLNSVLGGQFSSRINLNLREDKGYTYGAHSSFTYAKTIGHFAVSTSVQAEHTANSLSEIFDEIEKIKTTITEDEVAFAKSYLIKKYPAIFETYSQVARNVNTKVVFDLDDNYFNNYIENISKLTLQDLHNCAQEELNDAQLISLVVGDKNIVMEQLKNKFDFEIVELEI
ncbi:MAG: M16 family metallopeptidase [Rhodothermaceae bacterium]